MASIKKRFFKGGIQSLKQQLVDQLAAKANMRPMTIGNRRVGAPTFLGTSKPGAEFTYSPGYIDPKLKKMLTPSKRKWWQEKKTTPKDPDVKIRGTGPGRVFHQTAGEMPISKAGLQNEIKRIANLPEKKVVRTKKKKSTKTADYRTKQEQKYIDEGATPKEAKRLADSDVARIEEFKKVVKTPEETYTSGTVDPEATIVYQHADAPMSKDVDIQTGRILDDPEAASEIQTGAGSLVNIGRKLDPLSTIRSDLERHGDAKGLEILDKLISAGKKGEDVKQDTITRLTKRYHKIPVKRPDQQITQQLITTHLTDLAGQRKQLRGRSKRLTEIADSPSVSDKTGVKVRQRDWPADRYKRERLSGEPDPTKKSTEISYGTQKPLTEKEASPNVVGQASDPDSPVVKVKIKTDIGAGRTTVQEQKQINKLTEKNINLKIQLENSVATSRKKSNVPPGKRPLLTQNQNKIKDQILKNEEKIEELKTANYRTKKEQEYIDDGATPGEAKRLADSDVAQQDPKVTREQMREMLGKGSVGDADRDLKKGGQVRKRKTVKKAMQRKPRAKKSLSGSALVASLYD